VDGPQDSASPGFVGVVGVCWDGVEEEDNCWLLTSNLDNLLSGESGVLAGVESSKSNLLELSLSPPFSSTRNLQEGRLS